MSTRTLDELKDEIRRATASNDFSALPQVAIELAEIGTPVALAMQDRALGINAEQTGDTVGALEHFNRAHELLEELADQPGLAGITGNIANVHARTGNNERALEMYERSLEYSEGLGERLNMARLNNSISIIHAVTGDTATSLEYCHKTLALYEELEDRNGAAGVICNIGTLFKMTGNYPQALEQYHRALGELEHLDNRQFYANVLLNMGATYDELGDHEKAHDFFYRAFEIYEQLNFRSGMASALGNIGFVYSHRGDNATALEYLYRAKSMQEEIGDRRATAHVLGNIVNVLAASDRWNEAEEMSSALDAMHIDDPAEIVTRDVARSVIQEHLDRIDDAVDTLRNTLKFAREHDLTGSLPDVHLRLRDLAIKQNDLAAYVEHNNEYTRINEEINGKDTATKVAMLEAERKIAAERQEHQKHLAVLHSTLPKHIADRVSRGEVVNDHYDNAAVIFLDIAGFTTLSDQLTSDRIVSFLDTMFTTLDAVCKKHDVVKIKTIGDSYMAVAFPLESSSSEQRVASPQERAAAAALEMLHAVSHIVSPASFPDSSPASSPVRVRIGIHSGALTAGVLGKDRLQYDVWGDTVNVASRMESTGEPGRIHVSEAFATFLGLRPRNDSDSVPHDVRNDSSFAAGGEVKDVFPSASEEWHLALRGEVEIKGKGSMRTYWLERPLP